MSRRRELEGRLHALRDIGGVLRAMKNLALLETQKLTRVLVTQRRVVDSIEAAAADFFTFYPDPLRPVGEATPVVLLIGSERGFCGDFNERLLKRAEAFLKQSEGRHPLLIVAGRKLSAKLEGDRRVVASLPGPTVVEEVSVVLLDLMERLRDLQAQQQPRCPLDLTILHHSPGGDGEQIQVRRPFQPVRPHPIRASYPPFLTLDPHAFAAELLDQLLFVLLYEVAYSSLMAENVLRFHHMEQAMQRLDQDLSDLLLKRNAMRQEDITEEIEEIMLSADALPKPQAPARSMPGTT